MILTDLLLSDIQPSQFYLSKKNIDSVLQRFNPDDLSDFMPIPVYKINGKVIIANGHSRAYVAYKAGIKYVPLNLIEETNDTEAYIMRVEACIAKGVTRLSDLQDKILPQNEYFELWDEWCDALHETLYLKRMKEKNQ